MKRFLIALFFTPLLTLAYTSPGHPSGYVNDFAGILSPQTVATLNQTLTDFTASTSAEIAVVTIPTYGTDETIETYAVKLFKEWGIGKEKADNGLLLLISRDDREVKIEVGYGLEPVMTDIESGHIIRDIITPAFQAGDFDSGVTAAVERLTADINNGVEPAENMAPQFHFDGSWIYPMFIFLVFISSILARSSSWWAGGLIGGVIGFIFFHSLIVIVIVTILGLLFDYIVSKTYKKSKANGINPPWWIGGPGGRGGGGFGGGGFGGFGGGSSGGGGASGRW